jgi:hypothetical protein
MFQSRKDKHPGFGLTDHDRKNVNFLLTLNTEQLAEWMAEASEEDLMYAKELAEINHILNIDRAVYEVGDYQAASWVLQKFIPVVQKPVAKQPIVRRMTAWLQGLRR